jgi:hypothetical protein
VHLTSERQPDVVASPPENHVTGIASHRESRRENMPRTKRPSGRLAFGRLHRASRRQTGPEETPRRQVQMEGSGQQRTLRDKAPSSSTMDAGWARILQFLAAELAPTNVALRVTPGLRAQDRTKSRGPEEGRSNLGFLDNFRPRAPGDSTHAHARPFRPLGLGNRARHRRRGMGRSRAQPTWKVIRPGTFCRL